MGHRRKKNNKITSCLICSKSEVPARHLDIDACRHLNIQIQNLGEKTDPEQYIWGSPILPMEYRRVQREQRTELQEAARGRERKSSQVKGLKKCWWLERERTRKIYYPYDQKKRTSEMWSVQQYQILQSSDEYPA